ncbi:hypothetical protein HUG10_00560 [Halorarum halophilum]|uniref:Uncharacterized protein n=1 Tax=Halorarum halophilum TaxID=2743090 RepID=A0A7D5KW56_9EURY|nr:hypothetical protein [Halobaculum halophilum]QLG26118.1 hypothetical protein HUG10_00560 [Halobaculum halophilum]
MKFKLVPEPPADRGFVTDVQAAVPLIPESEDDCCARLMRRCDLRSRDIARTWLTFLRALGLAEETPSGFRRVRASPTVDDLRRSFLDGVYGATDVADALASADDTDPLTVDEAFEALRDRVPTWERTRTDDWEGVWTDRAERMLGWFVLLDLAERRGEDYVPTATLSEYV